MTRPESARPARWLAGLALLSLCGVVVCLCTLPQPVAMADNQTEEQKAQAKETATESPKEQDEADKLKNLLEPHAITKGSMRLRVVGPDGKPMPNANIFVNASGVPKILNKDYSTDADGISVIELPKSVDLLRIWVRKEGHVAWFVNWEPQEQADGHLIPEEFTFPMKKGTKIAGFVKDADGKPIPNVRVQAKLEGHLDETGGRYVCNTWLATGEKYDKDDLNGPALTDENGRWTLNNVPPDKGAEVSVLLIHPDYISDQHWGGLQKEQKVTTAGFRDQTATIVMQRGISIAGQILDPEGQPVEHAVVIWGDNPYFTKGSQEIVTEADGRYRIPPLPTGKTRLTVVAKGWMPDSRIVETKTEMAPVDFRLKPGKTLRINFVDQSGRPVAGAYVGIDRWRGAIGLYNNKHPNVVDTQIPDEADENGVYEWTWAPEDGVTYNFGKEGYADTTEELVATDETQTLVLKTAMTISGTVRDAKTGQRIDNFVLVPVDYFSADSSCLERYNSRPFTAGTFAHEVTRTDIKAGIQIEALGYRIYRTSKRYEPGDESEILNVQLQPAEPYTGRVVDPAGVPVKDASVYVVTADQQSSSFNLNQEHRDNGEYYRVQTNSSGAFEVLAQIDRYAVVVVAPHGYAEVRREANQLPGEIRLQPWARVKGRLVQSGKPVPNYQIYLRAIGTGGVGEPDVRNNLGVTTDNQGQFTFARVPPVPCHVEADLHFSRDSVLTSSRSMPLDPNPGDNIEILFGSGGAEITGQLVVENQSPDFDCHFSLSYLVAKRPGLTPPASLAGKGFDWHKGWNITWRSSTVGSAYLDTLHHWFVKPSPEGKIHISGVEPGDYELAVNLYGSTKGCLVEPVAQRVIPVSIKPDQQTLDLGRLVIPSLAIPQVGQAAPEFEFTDTTGKKTSLVAARGKFVLIDFWASWCRPCVAKLSDVEQLRQQYAQSNPIVVIGVNLDDQPQQAQTLIKSKSLAWQHVLLGDWRTTDVPRQFGILSIPTYILIDPTGRIAVHSNSLDKVAEALKAVNRR